MQKLFLFLLAINLTTSLFCVNDTTSDAKTKKNPIVPYMKKKHMKEKHISIASNKKVDNYFNIAYEAFVACINSAENSHRVSECREMAYESTDLVNVLKDWITKISDEKLQNTVNHIEKSYERFKNNVEQTYKERMNSFENSLQSHCLNSHKNLEPQANQDCK